ncbi:antibiotic biosynthesis monooxygenase [Pantanalinema rosaneae CENA516]|uniref:antibiotic biosynthesis monooxygenase n=1 Tax=Pantanalinema rosaneae TaxID=1620701 RepID=UPI003D6EB361
MSELTPSEPYILVNTFWPVGGGIDALIAFQLAEMREMGTEAAAFGWLGNEVYRSHDGTRLIVVTRFRSAEAHERWAETERTQQHFQELTSLVTKVLSVPVAFVAGHGDSPLGCGANRTRPGVP